MNLQIAGLIFDATGIMILGLPSLVRPVKQISEQAGTYWDGNLHLAMALASSRVDTATGSVLLLIGFLLQVVSLNNVEASLVVVVMLYGSLAVALLVYCFSLREKWSKMIGNRVKSAWEIEMERDR